MAIEVDLAAPFQSDRLLEIRTSRMKQMPGLDVMSGIDKLQRQGPMKITKLGLEGDEHDPTFHGGVDKAILGCKFSPPLPSPFSFFSPLTLPVFVFSIRVQQLTSML